MEDDSRYFLELKLVAIHGNEICATPVAVILIQKHDP
jgi:hypothetical protein